MLRFELKYNQECRQNITLTNVSGTYLVYKVKTTLPDTYYVSPNVDCLKDGEEVKIGVTLINDECNKYIDRHISGKSTSVDKHRFKVECVNVTAADYENLKRKDLAPKERSEKFSDFLKTLDKDKHALKFRVEYVYPEIAEEDTSTIVHHEPVSSGKKMAAAPVSDAGFNEYGGQGIDAVISELQVLRSKYDKVLELTVNLTAEKDTMIARLNAKQTERKEITKLKERERKGAKALANASKKRGMFSQTFLIMAAILAYILGYYLEHVKIFGGTGAKSEL